MISRLTELYSKLIYDLPGINEFLPYLDDRMRQAARNFCIETEAWREKLTFYIKDADDAYDDAYDAAIALGMSTAAAVERGNLAKDSALEYVLKPHYDADVIRPWKVWDDHDAPDTPLVDVQEYDFDVATSTLRFKNTRRSYSPVATTWATTTSYAAGDYIISGDSTGHRYLCAIAHTSGTFATDLAAYKWQVMPDDLVVKVVLMPRVDTVEIAGWFMEKWSNAIVAQTKVLLMSEVGKKWSAPDRVPYFTAQYFDECAKAKRERFTEDLSCGIQFESPMWIP